MKTKTLEIPIEFPSDLSDDDITLCLDKIMTILAIENEGYQSKGIRVFNPETIGEGWKRINKFTFYFDKWYLK